MTKTTPGDGIGAATVALFVGVASLGNPDQLVQCFALGCGALVAITTVIAHAKRNL